MGAIAFNTTQAQGKIQKILNSLKTPKTRRQLEQELFAAHNYLIKYLKYMKDNKLVYIAGWASLPDQRKIPMYGVGDYPDVPKPPPIDRKELHRRQWEKVKSDKELYEEYRERRTRRETLKRTKPFADPMLQWMRV